MPDRVITTREQPMIRRSGMTGKYNRKKICTGSGKNQNPWFFHTLRTVSCFVLYLRKDALLLEKVH